MKWILKFTGNKLNILNWLIRSQTYSFRIAITYFTSKCLLLPLCVGCIVVLGALSILAIVLLRTVELVALI